MCTISGTCGCSGGLGSFLLALSGQVLLWLLKTAAKLLQLLLVALVALTLWAAPRGWRLARRGYRAGRRRWLMRPVLLDRQPVAAVTATTAPEQVLWSELMKKQEANA